MGLSQHMTLNGEQKLAFVLILERFIQVIKTLPPSELHAQLLFYSEEALDLLSNGLALEFSSLKYTLEQLFRLGHDPRVAISLGDELSTLQGHWTLISRQLSLHGV